MIVFVESSIVIVVLLGMCRVVSRIDIMYGMFSSRFMIMVCVFIVLMLTITVLVGMNSGVYDGLVFGVIRMLFGFSVNGLVGLRIICVCFVVCFLELVVFLRIVFDVVMLIIVVFLCV